jgi:hypothetical protein
VGAEGFRGRSVLGWKGITVLLEGWRIPLRG